MSAMNRAVQAAASPNSRRATRATRTAPVVEMRDYPSPASSIHSRDSMDSKDDDEDDKDDGEEDDKEDFTRGNADFVNVDIERGLPAVKQEAQQPASNPNVVDFDGPNDPAMAVNWSPTKKWTTVAIISAATFISPLASSMFAPGVPDVLSEFHSTNELLGTLVVTIYVLGYAAGPIVVAPASELFGRVPVFIISQLLFVIFTVACAVSSNLNMLIGFRFLEGIAGSTPLTIGGGTIADLFIQEERGGAMVIWTFGTVMGPVVGPIAGGFLAQAAGWRWVFWLLTIASGVIGIAFVLFLRETNSVALLAKKTRKLRKETGNKELRSKLGSDVPALTLFRKSIIRPLKMLFCSPIVFILAMLMAFAYGLLFILVTTLSEVFEDVYDFGAGVVGLTFLGIGIGIVIGLVAFGMTSDKGIKAKKAKGLPIGPEDRLTFLIPGAFCLPIGLFIYGWTADKHVQWVVPILGTGIFALGFIAIFMAIQTYLVDAFTRHAASAIAACTIIRSIVGCVFPLAGLPMIQSLGLGWANSLLGFIAVAMIPAPFLIMKYGERIRTNPKFQVKL